MLSTTLAWCLTHALFPYPARWCRVGLRSVGTIAAWALVVAAAGIAVASLALAAVKALRRKD